MDPGTGRGSAPSLNREGPPKVPLALGFNDNHYLLGMMEQGDTIYPNYQPILAYLLPSMNSRKSLWEKLSTGIPPLFSSIPFAKVNRALNAFFTESDV